MNEVSKVYQMTFDFMSNIPNQETHTTVQDDIPEDTKVLRAKLNIEETFEKIELGLGISMFYKDEYINSEDIEYIVTHEYDVVEFVDACVDQAVINAGDMITAGVTDIGPQVLVGENNLLKLTTGTIREDGKLVKAKDHPKPDIAGEVERQRDK